MSSDFTEEEKKLIASFRHLKVTPKADTPADLQTWIKDNGHTLCGATATDPSAAAAHITVNNYQPRLPIFYGDTETLTKGEATYKQWIQEVRLLR